MGAKATGELIESVRSVLGGDFSEMNIIRALHLAKNDVTAAINILLDTPSFSPRHKSSPFQMTPTPPSPSSSSPSSSSSTKRISDSERAADIEKMRQDDGLTELQGSLSTSKPLTSTGSDWLCVGSAELTGLSTCKGRKIKVGDPVVISFPSKSNASLSSGTKTFGRGRPVATTSEIVRFSSQQSGEIGRIPTEWSRCLLPLFNAEKIRIEAYCKWAPEILSIMDTVVLSVSVYLNSSMFRKYQQTPLKENRQSPDESIVQPLPTLFRLLGLSPFKKAEFTPEDLYSRKRSIGTKDNSGIHLPLEKCRKLSSNPIKMENVQEDSISETDMDKIVGTSDSSYLEEMDPPDTLQCELRPYQKQALHWMCQLEKGRDLEEAATTLHPCWEAYHLGEKSEFTIYLNAFSGDATVEFPSALQISRGGILADAMGLGKTIMTIALLLSDPPGDRLGIHPGGQACESRELNKDVDLPPNHSNTITKIPGFNKLIKATRLLQINGGNLIVCPMTLLGQWKNTEDNGGLYSVSWFRVVLDEAHTIKSSKSQVSMAAAALAAERRWCLTGTPIQNNLEDIYSLLRFLRVEPWRSWGWWNRLIQKPFEEGDERGLKLVQSILRPIMLRRTKCSTDKEGRPILVLPPADVQVIYCELTEAERDFYEALFKRSKVKFDQFVQQGRVLHNYASILELLLRLRQCCDHPFLVMSRGDTQDFTDLNKLARRFMKGSQDDLDGESSSAPPKAFVQEVIEELRKGEQGECPICLEAFEDAVLTPCAHRLCRECLLASWRSAMSGLCPVCRKNINRQGLITAPTESRFRVDVERNWIESSKVSILLNELERLHSLGSKSIVFSQWTAFLDLLQIAFSRRNLPFIRLDGTLNQQQREKVIKKFSEENDALVLLMSLKAGGVGVNLTAASNAFLLDPWWNPAVEEQAVMRIHRIGQTKNVTIRKFIVKGTVEERMEAVQARKQRMISGALTDQEVRNARIEELKMLFT
ncbi:DNA repair protein RAD5A isoform X3 [Nymphaea colorata]|uniref:DNA repair protein RAD5A isoform X3 n=1 Tax=Nymphaea colorata TaxID=210225 RepID=UPI00129E59F5|nr:DNA repair protein RAD5A isoform X3 [Nymphaea colorata]